MEDKELLEAIGQMIAPIREDLTVVKEDLAVVKQRLDAIEHKSDVLMTGVRLACAVGLLVEALMPLWEEHKARKEAEENEECWSEDAGAADR